jgi:hypothetical protein
MCMSCGCGEVNNDHDNPANITLNQMQKAAGAAKINIEQAANNIHHAARQYRDQNQAAAQAAAPHEAGASGVAGLPGASLAGGNYRPGDMLGTTSATPNAATVTDAIPAAPGLDDIDPTVVAERQAALGDIG